MLSDVVRGDSIQNVRIAVANVYPHLTQIRSHPDGLCDVKDLFGIAAVSGDELTGRPSGPIEQYVVDRHTVGLPRITERQTHIAQVVAIELRQPNRLARSGQCSSAVIGGAHVTAKVGTPWSRARSRGSRALDCGRSRYHRLRNREIIEPHNVSHRHRQVKRRLPVRRVECPRLRRMLIDSQPYVEGTFNLLHGSGNRHNQPIGWRACDNKTVRTRKIDHCLIVFRRRGKLLRKLRYAEKLVICRTI